MTRSSRSHRGHRASAEQARAAIARAVEFVGEKAGGGRGLAVVGFSLGAWFAVFGKDIGVWYPGLATPSGGRRHLVYEPSFGVIQKPGLVGVYRPHWRAPNVEGLYFASETFRSRGIGVDRAARAGLTVVEDILGKRLSGFEESWRY